MYRVSKSFNFPIFQFSNLPIIFSLFWKLLAIKKNTIIHVHVANAFIPEIVFLISKIKRIPYVAHIHLDVDPSGFFGFLLKTYKKYTFF